VVGLFVGLGVSGRAPKAAAGTTGVSPGVFLIGNDVETVSLASLQAGGAKTNAVAQPGGASAVAVNTNATRAVAVYPDDGDATLEEFDARTGADLGAFSLPAGVSRTEELVGLSMDPADSNVAFSVAFVLSVNGLGTWQVDRLNLSARTQSFSGSLANLNYESQAISPDGGTLFAGGENANGLDGVLSIPISNPNAFVTWTGRALGGVFDLAVAPNGSRLYSVLNYLGAHSLIAWNLPLAATSAPVVRQPLAGNTGPGLAISPDGQTVFTATYSPSAVAPVPSTLQSLSASTGAPLRAATIPIESTSSGSGVMGLAVSPDGSTLLAFGPNPPGAVFIPARVYPVQLPGLAVGTPSNTQTSFTPGPQNIAITPDQAPAASVAPTSGAGCTSTTISAAGSNVVYGSIVNYAWNFGDGQTATSGGPTVQHTYTAAGTYNVTVTETDSAGTSVPPAVPGTFFAVNSTGQTPFKRASNSARSSAPVAISSCGSPPPPPPATTTTTKGSTTTKPTTKPGQPKASIPKLVLNPIVGSPGTIVTVTGTGFRANTPITISWSVSTGSIVVTSDPHGNLAPTPLPILIPDVLGPRFAVASSSPQAKAAFLVVPGTAEPGGDQGVGVYLFRSEGES
jgi:hypothetical protein